MKEKIRKLFSSEITLAEFLLDDERELELDDFIIDAQNDKIHIDFGSDGESFDMSDIKFNPVKESDQKDLTSSVINLKKEWSSLLKDEKYLNDLDDFMTKFHLTKIDINSQDEEVRFYSGKYSLAEGLDLYNQ